MGVKAILDRQIYTDPVPAPLRPLRIGSGGAEKRLLALEVRMRGRDERIHSILYHMNGHALV